MKKLLLASVISVALTGGAIAQQMETIETFADANKNNMAVAADHVYLRCFTLLTLIGKLFYENEQHDQHYTEMGEKFLGWSAGYLKYASKSQYFNESFAKNQTERMAVAYADLMANSRARTGDRFKDPVVSADFSFCTDVAKRVFK